MNAETPGIRAAFLPLLSALCASATAEVPTYRVEVIETFETTTVIRGASQNGRIVGYQVIDGIARAFVAAPGNGLSLLPLADGYTSADAFDVNSAGRIVGTASETGSAFDFGQPAVWEPDDVEGYRIRFPEQFTMLPGPLGDMSIDGGQVVAVNEAGTLIGWSRLQGFQGGPATRFSLTGPPHDLSELGFEATPRDVNDDGVVVGGQFKLELDTAEVSDIGVPPPIPGNVQFTDAIAFAINNQNESVVAANLASVPTENYLTYTHHDATGYQRINPDELPSRFVGFYDSNNLGDVVSPAGVWFSAEDALVPGLDTLLTPESERWSVARGFITDDRRIYTTAQDFSTGTSALVVLVPVGDSVFEHGFESTQ